MSDFILVPVDDDGCMGPIAGRCCLVGCAWLFLGGLGTGAAAGGYIVKGIKTLLCRRRGGMR